MAGLVWLAWRPGLGDPSFMGWLTVAAYFAGAGLWFWRRPLAPAWARNFSAALAYGLLILGINKLFNFTGVMTALLQELAYQVQWYDQRRIGQTVILALLLAFSVVAAAYLFFRKIELSSGMRVALVGLVFLLALALGRAASLHAVDALLYRPIAGIKLNWVLELAGIGLASLPALRKI